MKTIVIIPTYNEKETIEEMVKRIFVLPGDIEALIVDDNSPDGTGQIADRLAARYPKLEVMHRLNNRGRGLAEVEAFKRAIEKRADYIIEMDADLSHDPVYIPSLINNMESADLVIGSRYMKGGSDPERGFIRKFISVMANVYIRFIMGLPAIRDCTSGFRCFRRSLLESIDLDSIRSTGPSIITEVLYRCRKSRIKEVPYMFRERAGGSSKFDLKAMTDSLYFALLLRLQGIFPRK